MSSSHPYIDVRKHVETIAKLAYNCNNLTFDIALPIDGRYDKTFLPEYVFIPTGLLARKVYKLVSWCNTGATYCEAHHIKAYQEIAKMSQNYNDVSTP
jgi:hypothetical protein